MYKERPISVTLARPCLRNHQLRDVKKKKMPEGAAIKNNKKKSNKAVKSQKVSKHSNEYQNRKFI